MSEYIAVGSFIKPHGIKGEIVIRFFNPDFAFNEQIIKEKKLILYILDTNKYLKNIDNNFNNSNNNIALELSYLPLSIARIKNGNKQYFIKINNIDTIEEAEKFRNIKIFIKKEQLHLEKNEYLISDLIGLKCLNALNNDIGTIVEIHQGDTDIIEIKSENTVYFLPMTDDNIKEINIKDKIAVIQNEELYKI
ncbi:MAG: 16S rRNA processing protein RimM [Candidatus Acididesulfobacter diazotrophicus]|jgi:16S rRNA processing protein RimM|uniref:Ribosome maturation factor RimM n=1 Tax=Candidatus Acididesulfobacter diazotrophicus TaxID=2597226 RepID=A0A519BK35_9DELT|nr:MAG: 16S rRNA processing protein RimM [Candidatus Acididesulfobacter diazotrophicus]